MCTSDTVLQANVGLYCGDVIGGGSSQLILILPIWRRWLELRGPVLGYNGIFVLHEIGALDEIIDMKDRCIK